MGARCVATNPAGARCLYGAVHGGAVHGNSGHLFADDPNRYPFLLGKLQSAVTMFLAGTADRDFLADTLAEVEKAS